MKSGRRMEGGGNIRAIAATDNLTCGDLASLQGVAPATVCSQNLESSGGAKDRRWRDSCKLARSPQVRLSVAAMGSNIPTAFHPSTLFICFDLLRMIALPNVRGPPLPLISRRR